MLMDDLITQMLNYGLDTDDLKHLEKLSDTKVLRRLPTNHRYLSQNKKSDVIKYIKAWVDLLEEQLTDSIDLPQPKSIFASEIVTR